MDMSSTHLYAVEEFEENPDGERRSMAPRSPLTSLALG